MKDRELVRDVILEHIDNMDTCPQVDWAGDVYYHEIDEDDFYDIAVEVENRMDYEKEWLWNFGFDYIMSLIESDMEWIESTLEAERDASLSHIRMGGI